MKMVRAEGAIGWINSGDLFRPAIQGGRGGALEGVLGGGRGAVGGGGAGRHVS